MAKAREIPGLTTDLPYGEVAARVLEVRMAEVIEHSAGVLDMSEIEGVHSMRVATRRLRAAIEIFWPCFPKEEEKRALKAVKALADALGERRDRDVAIEALSTFAAAMPAPDRPGIQSLVARYADEQERANVALERFVEPERLEGIRVLVLGLASAARRAAGTEEPEAEPSATPEPEAEPSAAPEPEAEPSAAPQPESPAAVRPVPPASAGVTNGAGSEGAR